MQKAAERIVPAQHSLYAFPSLCVAPLGLATPMRAAALARLLLALALLLSVACAADAKPGSKVKRRSVRGRVNLGPELGKHGAASKRERAAARARHNQGWTNATLAPPSCGLPPRGYDPPQWRREPPPSRRVSMRGWLVCPLAAQVHTPLFALPGEAWPTRDEGFSASFKGKTRSLNLSPADGVARLVRAVVVRQAAPRALTRSSPTDDGRGRGGLDPARLVLVRRRAAAGRAAAAARGGG